jgi:hypothetical protein
MNTIMEEKIKQAFQEWKQTEQPKEITVETHTKNQKLSNMLLDMIDKNPGITGKDLRTYVTREMPTVPISYVPALLKGFYDKNFVSRIEVPPSGSVGRATYAYTSIPVHVQEKMPKREKVRAYTKKGKAKPVHEDKGITTLIPKERTERMAMHPLTVGTTTVYITIHTGSETTYSLRLEEAKVIYQQLNQIFGGVR